MINNGTPTFTIKPYSLKTMAEIYGVSKPTFKAWIKPFQTEIGEIQGRYLSITQVKLIMLKLDFPTQLHLEIQ